MRDRARRAADALGPGPARRVALRLAVQAEQLNSARVLGLRTVRVWRLARTKVYLSPQAFGVVAPDFEDLPWRERMHCTHRATGELLAAAAFSCLADGTLVVRRLAMSRTRSGDPLPGATAAACVLVHRLHYMGRGLRGPRKVLAEAEAGLTTNQLHALGFRHLGFGASPSYMRDAPESRRGLLASRIRGASERFGGRR